MNPIARRMKKYLYAGAAAALMGATLAGTTAAPAQAAARDGSCNSGEFCLYYGANHTGSRIDAVGTTRAYGGTGSGCLKFISAGTGRGTCVKNHAASVWNRTGRPASIFYNSDFGSTYDIIPSGAKVNLNSNVHKDNGSQILGDASLRFPLNVTQAQIKNHTPPWCWNSKVNCHHDYNASDIFANSGTAVVSPVNGVVMTKRVRDGSPASVGSTVTVKDGFGRLWYLAHMHHNPAPVVVEGQRVVKGQRIGTVGTRYHALNTPSHLHIDMRVGVNSRVSCSRAACAAYGFVNNQPLLRTAFLQRPVG